eukprot:Gregarina_sp_Poly_1__748@NODE_117_length_13667_cov_177_395147_g104_i0_p7_GENE_NODE_117_length_13667_cov_177_395147_g104_i0NODE_117_length_13667_cov_177_395147_g104_i0_p7_ORF_typecomplete_len229_score24_90_NODE_117_length_13667_cov_177_395147_g104_i01043011116
MSAIKRLELFSFDEFDTCEPRPISESEIGLFAKQSFGIGDAVYQELPIRCIATNIARRLLPLCEWCWTNTANEILQNQRISKPLLNLSPVGIDPCFCSKRCEEKFCNSGWKQFKMEHAETALALERLFTDIDDRLLLAFQMMLDCQRNDEDQLQRWFDFFFIGKKWSSVFPNNNECHDRLHNAFDSWDCIPFPFDLLDSMAVSFEAPLTFNVVQGMLLTRSGLKISRV